MIGPMAMSPLQATSSLKSPPVFRVQGLGFGVWFGDKLVEEPACVVGPRVERNERCAGDEARVCGCCRIVRVCVAG